MMVDAWKTDCRHGRPQSCYTGGNGVAMSHDGIDRDAAILHAPDPLEAHSS